MRRTPNQQVIHRADGSVWHRTVYGVRQHEHATMGLILHEDMYERVYLRGEEWWEHPTDWRSYASVTTSRMFDVDYDIPWPEERERP